MSESDPVTKNRIEFQLGSKLPGTSSEALLWSPEYGVRSGIHDSLTFYMRVSHLVSFSGFSSKKTSLSVGFHSVVTWLHLLFGNLTPH